MKNKYTLLLLFAVFCCMGVQCKEKEEEKGPVLAEELAKLPKVTTGGYGTFGCLLNGWAWPAEEEFHFSSFVEIFYQGGVKITNIMGYTTKENSPFPEYKDIVNISTDDITGPGEYTIALDDYKTDFVAIRYKEIRYHSGVSNPGALLYLNIHDMDTIRRTISGTFRITLKDATRTQTMHLQYGRFDSRY